MWSANFCRYCTWPSLPYTLLQNKALPNGLTNITAIYQSLQAVNHTLTSLSCRWYAALVFNDLKLQWFIVSLSSLAQHAKCRSYTLSCSCTLLASDQSNSSAPQDEAAWRANLQSLLVTARTSRLPHDVEPVCLHKRRRVSTVGEKPTRIRITSLKHCAMLQSNHEALVIECYGWWNLGLVSPRVLWTANALHCIKTFADVPQDWHSSGCRRLDGIYSTTILRVGAMFWYGLRVVSSMKRYVKSHNAYNEKALHYRLVEAKNGVFETLGHYCVPCLI